MYFQHIKDLSLLPIDDKLQQGFIFLRNKLQKSIGTHALYPKQAHS